MKHFLCFGYMRFIRPVAALFFSLVAAHGNVFGMTIDLAPDGSNRVSKIRAVVETFPADANDISKLEGRARDNRPVVSFLKSYYLFGSQGNRDRLLSLYSEGMRPELSKEFTSSEAVKRQFEDLGGVNVNAIFSWGVYRSVLVVHRSKQNPNNRYPWVHTVACPRECVFVQQPTLSQIASYLFYLQRTGKVTPAIDAAKDGQYKTLILNPVFSDSAAKLSAASADPLELHLSPLDPATAEEARTMMRDLINFANDKGANPASLAALFDEGLPSAYPRKTAASQSANLFSWDAYLSSIRQRTWMPALMFRVSENSIILIAKSSEAELIFLPMDKVGGKWRLLTVPSKAAFWPIIESQSFIEALKPMLK